jgi:hypothetical protein
MAFKAASRCIPQAVRWSASRQVIDRQHLTGSGEPPSATASWLLSMSAKSFAVSEEIPMAGMSSTTATVRPSVSHTIQRCFGAFRTVYLMEVKSSSEFSFLTNQVGFELKHPTLSGFRFNLF